MRVHRLAARVVAIAAFVGISPTALAHDFLLVPSKFAVAPSEPVKLDLKVGHAGDWEILPRNSERFEKFIAMGPKGEQPVVGIEGQKPAGLMKWAEDGVYVVGYRSLPRSHEMQPAKFDDYLREEGLEKFADLRKQRGESDKPGKEIYSRAAKAIVTVGPGASPSTSAKSDASVAAVDRDLGFRYELICQNDPTSAKPGDTITVLAEFENTPAPGVRVCLVNPITDEHVATVRTGEDGRAKITMPPAEKAPSEGGWALLSIYMQEAPKDSGADWESIWASVTFATSSGESSASAASTTQP